MESTLKKHRKERGMRLRFNGRDHTEKFKKSDLQNCRFECLCACMGIMFFIPLVSIPESRFGRYWANQGLIILMIELACTVAGFAVGGMLSLLSLIPYIGIVFDMIKVITSITFFSVSLYYIIFACVQVVNYRAKDVPFFGYIRFIK